MTRHDPLVSLAQMRDYTQEAIQMADGYDRNGLGENRMLVLALTRLVEIIGEAANRIPVEIQDRHGAIPWNEIIGMRNRLVHGYDIISLDILWNTVQQKLPQLLETMHSMDWESRSIEDKLSEDAPDTLA